MSKRHILPSLITLSLVAGCGSDPLTTPPQVRPTLGAPIVAPADSWTWVDFPDSACDDGTPTGIAVNPSTRSKHVLMFLNGGGACWNYTTCFDLNTAAHGPFGKSEFNGLMDQLPGTVLDRSDPTNPFADYSMVFVPYCTGDVHAGDNVITYTLGTKPPRTVHHVGHANLTSFLSRVAATWPDADKAVMSGSSAGGFGAAFNYDSFRRYFPDHQSYLLDDSGPVLIGDDVPPGFRDAWYASWRLDKVLDPLCTACRNDLSALVPIMAKRYPNDRMALLSYTQDKVIGGYFLQSGPNFQTALYSVATTLLDPDPQFHYYFVDGNSHTFLGHPAGTTSHGVALDDWLKQEVTDDPAWKSVKP